MAYIQKESGEQTTYNTDKLYHSLEKTGASEELIQYIIRRVDEEFVEGMTTRKIHKIAFKILKQQSGDMAARYQLKKALMQLGPAGYPFERFFGELLRAQGYEVNVGVALEGNCIDHEVDVVAIKKNKRLLVECKYHNRQGLKTRVQVPLYFKSRFIDLYQKAKTETDHKEHLHEGWLVTNTRFSEDALKYGQCAGIHMVSWSFPSKGSIMDRMNYSGVYPITCLTTLPSAQKKWLIKNEVILCSTLVSNPQLLIDLGINPRKAQTVINECEKLCSNGHS